MKLLGKRIYSKEFRLFAFGCVHYGCESHDEDLFIEFLKKVESTPNAVVFGLGDYLDFARTTWRGQMKSMGDDDTFFESIDDMVDGQLVRPLCAKILRYCPSFAEKCLLLIEGNHHYKYGSGTRIGQTTTEAMSTALKVPYGGLAAWVQLRTYRSKGSYKFGHGHNMNILLNHGTSSSSNAVAAALGKLERQTVTGWRDVDVLLSSHNHMLGHVVATQLGVPQKGELRLIEYEILMVKSGCFKKAYMNGAKSSSYEEKNLFRPNRRGWFECTAKIHQGNTRKGGFERWQFTDFLN